MNYSAALLLCFFFSGATALIYEVIWVRLLALTFGNTVYAIGVVLTSFMSGLSLGSLLLGRWADRGRNLLKGYGFLETGIAFSALFSPLLLDKITSVYLSFSITSMPLGAVSVIRYIMSMLVLLLPTTLMGGTLPVLSRYLIHSDEDFEKKVGLLYSLNTIGGVLGTFLVGFFLIRFFGLNAVLKATAFVNLCIGATAYYLGVRARQQLESASATSGETTKKERSQGQVYALCAFFLSGVAGMTCEVAWNRLLAGVIGSSTYSFSIVLIGFLSGIGLGSLAVSYISSRRRLGLIHFSLIEIAIGITCFSTIFVFNVLPSMMSRGMQLAGYSYDGVLVAEMIIVLFYILVPTTLFGATFPVIAAIYGEGRNHCGRRIGNIYAANTFGAIAGTALASFFLLPEFGSTLSLKIASTLALLVGITGLHLLRRPRLLRASLALLVIPLIPVNISDGMLVSGVAIDGNPREEQKFLYLKEGLNATIAVTVNDDGSVTLSTNGKADGSTGTDMSTQLGLAYLPLILHKNPSDVLVVGYGTGVTVRAAVNFPAVSRVEAVEIEPAVVRASRFFEQVNEGVTRDPKMKMIIDDARSYIIGSKKTFDVIISEPSNPWISGIGNLFSREYYESSRSKLKKGGIFCQWLQLYRLRTEVLKMVIKTFSAVFPETTIWQCAPGDILLIGFTEPQGKFDYDDIAGKLRGDVARGLKAYLNIYDPMDFLSYYVMGSNGVWAITQGAAMNTDDMPLLEFEAPLSLYSDTHLENNKLLRDNMTLPEIKGHDDPGSLLKEFFFRKTLNYVKLGIPVDNQWYLSMPPARRDYLLNRSIALDPAYPERDSAVEMALAYKGDDLDLLGEIIEIELRKKRLDQALVHLKKVEGLPVNVVKHSGIYYRAGMEFLQSGDAVRAERYLKKSIETNGYNILPLIALADLYVQGNNGVAACDYYRKALDLSAGEKKRQIKERIERNCGGR